METIFMTKHVLITGSNGQLGQELKALVAKQTDKNDDTQFFFTDRDSLDITDKNALTAFIETKSINTIINCAAYTAVDKAEEDWETAYKINHIAVRNMAELSKEKGIWLIHVSTDYVFDGTNDIPLCEEDSCNPQGVYAKSKHKGEEEISRINPVGAIIIRTSWIYSSFGHNFVHTMLRLGKERESLSVVSDQIGTPTYARDLAAAILKIVRKGIIPSKHVEIYHYSNEGFCSWYDFAQAIFEISNINCKVSPITTEQYPTPAKRPLYSVLNKKKIVNTYDLKIPYWKDSLKSCIALLNS
jgi:dTDP-4-dehydrorhamnose reductase